MTYYYGEINVTSDDPQMRKSVADTIQKHLMNSAEFEDAPWIRDINAFIPEICWSRYGRLVGEHVQFLESLTSDASVEIKTGQRRLLEFFLSPFLKYQDEALRER